MSEGTSNESWEQREAKEEAAKLIDPRGIFATEFKVFGGEDVPDDPLGWSPWWVRETRTFASNPRFAAAMQSVIDAHSAAVESTAQLLAAQEALEGTIRTLQREEVIKAEVIEYLGAQGMNVGPDTIININYVDQPEE